MNNNLYYYMANSVSGQDKPNLALWLAGKIAILPALGTICCGPQEKFSWKPYNWTYPLLTELELFSQDGWILASFFFSELMDLYTQPYSVAVNEQRQKKEELGQYPTILTSHLVDNPYVVHCQSNCIIFIMSVLPCHSRNRCKPRANCRQATNRHRIL